MKTFPNTLNITTNKVILLGGNQFNPCLSAGAVKRVKSIFQDFSIEVDLTFFLDNRYDERLVDMVENWGTSLYDGFTPGFHDKLEVCEVERGVPYVIQHDFELGESLVPLKYFQVLLFE